MKITLLLLILLTLTGCKEQDSEIYLYSFFKGNGEDGLHLASSRDGYNWNVLNNDASFLTPNVGENKLMRDPCIIKGGDGKFHMVWTVSWNGKGIGYANSKDLINWSDQKYIPVMKHEPDARNCWAPEIFYDANSEEYLIHWATTIPGQFPATDTLGDDGYNHRMYYTTTKDFVDFTETKLLYDEGFNVIDATIVKDENSYFMFLKNETLLPDAEKNIRIAKSDNLLHGYSPASEKISPNWVEGPTVIKIKDTWIVYYDMYTQHKMGAVASTDLENWTDLSDKINFPKGMRHGSVFKAKKSVLDNLLSLEQ